MFKRIALALLAVLLVTVMPCRLAAQDTQVDNKSLLWKISGHGLTKPSYLFGSMHLLCADDYVWTPVMNESLLQSEVVCFEMNLDDPTVVMQAANSFIDKSGKKLEEYFTKEDYKELEDYFQNKLNISLSMFQQMKPMGLESMLMLFGQACTNPVSYEDSIMKTAKKSGKEITGLEDVQEQIVVLDKIPSDSIVKDIMDEIRNKNKYDADFKQLTAAYKKQDLQALYNLIKNSKGLDDDMGELLDDRNKKWIARIENKITGHSVFIAVGAGHLWGDNGVISLLKKQGYTVEPAK